jgi:hypothetical protein
MAAAGRCTCPRYRMDADFPLSGADDMTDTRIQQFANIATVTACACFTVFIVCLTIRASWWVLTL